MTGASSIDRHLRRALQEARALNVRYEKALLAIGTHPDSSWYARQKCEEVLGADYRLALAPTHPAIPKPALFDQDAHR